VTSQSEGSLITAAQLLGCDKDELRKSLVSRSMQATKGGRGGTIIQYDSCLSYKQLHGIPADSAGIQSRRVAGLLRDLKRNSEMNMHFT